MKAEQNSNDISKLDLKDMKSKLAEFEKFAQEIISNGNEDQRLILKETIQNVSNYQQNIENNCGIGTKRPIENEIFPIDNKKLKRETITFHLPDELWLKVLNYMHSNDIFRSFVLVSKHFNNLAQDPNAVRFLYLSQIRSKKDYRNVVKVIARCKNLYEFKIHACKEYFEDLIQLTLKNNPKLKSLIVLSQFLGHREYKISDKCASYICQFGKELEILQFSRKINFKSQENVLHYVPTMLKLKTLKISGYSPKMLLPIAENCNKLERIDMIGCYPFDVDSYDKLFEKLSSSLKSLRITGAMLIAPWTQYQNNFQSSDRFLKNLALCENLQELEIPNVDLGKLGLEVIAAMHPLKKLHIDTLADPPQRTKDAIKDVDEFFKKFKLESLQDLKILRSRSTTNSIFKILINRQGCPKLERICFVGCPKLKINCLELDHFVKSCPNLKYFYLNTSNVSDISSELLTDIDKKITLKLSEKDNENWISIDEHIKQRLKGIDLS